MDCHSRPPRSFDPSAAGLLSIVRPSPCLRVSFADRPVLVQKRQRSLARFPSLVAAMIALKRLGLPRDVIAIIIWQTNLWSNFFHDESQTLREDRAMNKLVFDCQSKYDEIVECVRVETRLLKFEPGTLWPQKLTERRFVPKEHLTGRGPCVHRAIWARVMLNPDDNGSEGVLSLRHN